RRGGDHTGSLTTVACRAITRQATAAKKPVEPPPLLRRGEGAGGWGSPAAGILQFRMVGDHGPPALAASTEAIHASISEASRSGSRSCQPGAATSYWIVNTSRRSMPGLID